MAYAATTWVGVADIAGAYFAGLFLCNIAKPKSMLLKLNVASYLIFSPVFFYIGIKTDLRGMNKELLIFSSILLVVAIATKVIGCGLAKFANFQQNL